MTLADLPTVVAIESATQMTPWEEQIFQYCLRVGYDCWVAEIAEEIVAFGIISLVPKVGESHILDIAVRSDWQRKGIGQQMMQHLLQIAAEKQAWYVMLEVRKSNQNAINLYLKLGFNEIGERKNYYRTKNNREDAIILGLDLHVSPL
jgi:ribosomal-protein-alanine N-acetyltransferase